MNRSDPRYVLGHSEVELDRLTAQANLLKEHTELLFRRGGVAPGMTVLDIGCGPGDVSFLTADLVGPSGRVLGIDRSAEAVELAGARARQAGYENVEFRVADAANFQAEAQFDAIVGRLVLMYMADPVSVLSSLRKVLRPQGRTVLHEGDIDLFGSAPECPLINQARQWMLSAFDHSGAAMNMGSRLAQTLSGAGLEPEGCIVAQPAYVGRDLETGLEWFTNVLRRLVPMLDAEGIVAADTIQIDTLVPRMAAQAREKHAIVFAPRLVGIWAKH
jgi:ubiquinone/menaquinone biosynthesis C-methylase UbiE